MTSPPRADDDRVPDPDVLAQDLILVVEARRLDRDPLTSTGSGRRSESASCGHRDHDLRTTVVASSAGT
jgi:hypothetical protein